MDQQLLERVKAEFLAVHGKKLKRLRKNPDTAMLAGTRLVQAQILGNVEDEDALGTFAPVYTVPQASTYHATWQLLHRIADDMEVILAANENHCMFAFKFI